MKFKIVNAFEKKEDLYLSGYYVAEKPRDAEYLNAMREELAEQNKDEAGLLVTDRFVANEKTILFKSIPISTVYSLLMLHNNAFKLDMCIVYGKNMQGNSVRGKVEAFFAEHKL